MTNYRVIEILTNDFSGGKKTESIRWEGSDINALSKKYPPSEIFGADPLKHHEIEDGWIRYDYRFECQSEDGTWTECDDPRRRISAGLSDFEREIDAENRRMFPGDFMDDEPEEDDDYDDFYYDPADWE